MRNFLACALFMFLFSCNDETPKSSSAATAPAGTPANDSYEFGDSKFKQIGKNGMASMVSGDMDAWMAPYAEDAIFRWNGGDSLKGKAAIAAWWKKRRAEVIDSISFMNDVWLPIKVLKPEATTQLPGNYLLGWYMVKAKYKTGKSMSQRIHMVYHFNDQDKIDRVTQYIDMAPVTAATAK